PLVLGLFVVFAFLWYLAGVVHARPAMNIAVSVLAFLYVGFLGSFAALLLQVPLRKDGVTLLLLPIVGTVAYDVGAFFVGSRVGRTPLAPSISPNKTWEGLVAATSIDLLAAQAWRLRPERVAVADAELAPKLEELVPRGTEVWAGPGSLAAIASEAEVAVNGVVGFAGLPVTMAALEAGRRLALANKESLIAAGPVVQRARATPGAELVPGDSEHSAVHQCLRGGGHGEVRRIVLTASGGPFRGRRLEELGGVTVEDALAHPTW